MATPPKAGSRKTGTKRAPAAASKAPTVKGAAKPVAAPKAKAEQIAKVDAKVEKPEAKPVSPPVAKPAVAREPAKMVPAKAKPAPAKVVEPAKPVAAVPKPAPVEWPVAAMPVSPEPLAPPEPAPATTIETLTPLVVAASEVLSVNAAANMKGETIMTDAMETAKTYAEEAKTRMQSALTEMNDKAKTAMEKSAKAFEEMGDLAKGNLEAVVESSKIAAKGVESMGQEVAEFSRKSFEKTSATMKSFAAVKTPAEFFQLQSELMSQTMDSFASEASKNSEAMLKLVSDITQPISNRVSIVTEKMKSLAA